jgi:enamine deaminase RidA (YjgF/YER057c/UK114 family)
MIMKKQALDNMTAIVKEAGSELSHVLKVQGKVDLE